jgi:hypothetical protein
LEYIKDRRFVDDPTAINEPCWDYEDQAVLEDSVKGWDPLGPQGVAERAIGLVNITDHYCPNNTFCLSDMRRLYTDSNHCYNNTAIDYYSVCYTFNNDDANYVQKIDELRAYDDQYFASRPNHNLLPFRNESRVNDPNYIYSHQAINNS